MLDEHLGLFGPCFLRFFRLFCLRCVFLFSLSFLFVICCDFLVSGVFKRFLLYSLVLSGESSIIPTGHDCWAILPGVWKTKRCGICDLSQKTFKNGRGGSIFLLTQKKKTCQPMGETSGGCVDLSFYILLPVRYQKAGLVLSLTFFSSPFWERQLAS